MLYVTQAATEVLCQPSTAKLRITQAAVEALRLPETRAARTSQIAIEILRLSTAVQTDGQRQPTVIIVAG